MSTISLRFTAQEDRMDDMFAGMPTAMRCMANENFEVFIEYWHKIT